MVREIMLGFVMQKSKIECKMVGIAIDKIIFFVFISFLLFISPSLLIP